jgi:hypothetical protein
MTVIYPSSGSDGRTEATPTVPTDEPARASRHDDEIARAQIVGTAVEDGEELGLDAALAVLVPP